MSVLGTAPFARPHVVASSLASTSRAPACTQLRNYAVGRRIDRSPAGKREPDPVDPEVSKGPRSTKRVGTFLPLPANQLRHKLFNPAPEERQELNLPTFHANALTTKDAAGQVMVFTKPQGGVVKAYGLPKNLLLEFRVLSKPCSVVRDVTLSTIQTLEQAKNFPSRESRAVLTGKTGSGKSYLLLQAVEYCKSKDWIVLYIPRAINLVNSSTEYAYDARTRTYLQSEFSFQLLQRFQQVNAHLIGSLKLTKPFNLGRRELPVGTPFSELVNVAQRDKALSHFALETLLAELSWQSSYPVLLAIDDVQALYCNTYYRDPQFHGIKPYHLSVPRLLLEFLGGVRSFKNGAVLGAVSTTHTRFQMPFELSHALGVRHVHESRPFARPEPELVRYAKHLKNIPVPSHFEVKEAAALFEVWAKDRALHFMGTDEMFLTMYTQSSGNPREFVWKGLLSSFAV